ncbi:zonadhesin-like [Arctopsyche grandis]|uniref:zonadhesin-like n=1 Tax=Arctopsyche grandis TaxID=121162 RepID=UPI00406D8019
MDLSVKYFQILDTPFDGVKCPINQVFSHCGDDGCRPTCSRQVVTNCIAKCAKPDCICAPGFVRNSLDECVSPTSCQVPKVCNGLNEMYIDCVKDCKRMCSDLHLTRDDQLPVEISCSFEGCTPGCGCQPGFYRNDNNQCVTIETCNCPPNEKINRCPHSCSIRTCEAIGKKTPCLHENPFLFRCRPKCECEFNYRRDSNGVCIPVGKCPPLQCPRLNEIYDPCPKPCLDESCETATSFQSRCSPEVKECEPRCICTPGYLRNKNGDCIPAQNCRSGCQHFYRHLISLIEHCDDPNAVFHPCGNACPLTCSNMHQRHLCHKECQKGGGCVCRPGFVENEQGKCVTPQNCHKCKRNEVYKTCEYNECENTCRNPDMSSKCSPGSHCTNGCFCQPGYVRNDAGECIRRNECECGLNEVFSECGANGCQNTCQNPKLSMVCKGICTPGCVCAEGYLRNSKGACVLIKNCVKYCQDPNAEFHPCGNVCPKTCSNRNRGYRDCPNLCDENGGCVCKRGYVENSDGKCVEPEKCHTCRHNKIFKNCGNYQCEDTCDDPNLSITCNRGSNCEPGCFCLPGFVRNEGFECVPKIQCVSYPKCEGSHEVYSMCKHSACIKHVDETKPCTFTCTPGCECEKGYVRNENRDCVLASTVIDCANVPKCDRPNQIFSECGNTDCQATCGKKHNPRHFCLDECIPGCICSEGFLKNKKGECVPPDKCHSDLTCEGAYEVYSKCNNNACQKTCANKNENSICTAHCSPGCICRMGFVRNEMGKCVTPDHCVETPITCLKANEIFSKCGKNDCQETCESMDDKSICTHLCRPGCICKRDYVRNKSEKHCSDPNAVFDSCGNVCPTTCSNKDSRHKICPGTCLKSGGCVCKPGYVENSQGLCIPPEKCPNCGANEVFSCGSACDTTCATLGDTCPIINIKCNEMCYCVRGYARNSNNMCIPIKYCPPKIQCTAMNQIYNSCPKMCPPEETCEFYLSGAVYDCANPVDQPCKPRCECKQGYIRSVYNGDCVRKEQCCSDPNAEVVSCPNPCPGGTCQSPEFADCKIPCKIRGCQCKKGYVKDVNGKCIHLSSCPPPTCSGKNEVYSMCGGLGCDPICQTIFGSRSIQRFMEFAGRIVCSSMCSTPGCVCAEGYVRNPTGQCVHREDCPPPKCTGRYEVYTSCGGKGCEATCSTIFGGRSIQRFIKLGGKAVCLPSCSTPACVCAEGYTRDSITGQCVLTPDCPPPSCPGSHEEYTSCGGPGCEATCPLVFSGRTTQQFKYLSGKVTCPTGCSTPACVCADGYMRDSATGF